MGLLARIAKVFAADTPEQAKPGEVSYADLATATLFGAASGKFLVYNPSELISRRGYQIIDKMRVDEQVKAAMTFKKRTVNASGWAVVSPASQEHDWEVTQFVSDVLSKIPDTFDQAINEMLLALDYGFSATEKVWEQVDGKVVLSALKTRRPHNFYFELDPHGNIVTLKQAGNVLPADKFVVITYDREFQNPYGTTDLAAAYRPWWSKDNAYKWLAMLLERMGIPPIFMFYNPSAASGTNLGDMQTILKRLQASTVATIPRAKKDDVEPWAPELANNAANVFIPSIDMYDRHISKAVLMPGLLGFSSDADVGSLARSKTHFDSFMLVVGAIRTLMAATIQAQIVRPLVDMNFSGVTDYPQFQFLPIDDDANLETFKTWLALTNAGVVKNVEDDEKHIREALKFPERDYSEGETEDGEKPEPEDAQKPEAETDAEPARKDFADKHDYKTIAGKMDEAESQLKAALKAALASTRERVSKWVASNYGAKDFDPSSFVLPASAATRKAFADAFVASAEIGQDTARAEVKRSSSYKTPARPKQLPGETTKAAIKYLKQKSKIIAEKYDQRIQNAVRLALLTGLKTGDSSGEIMQRVNDVLDREDSAYAETVVRTNVTDAVNTARLAEFRDPDMSFFISAVKYSSILDDRTTPVCEHLHGKLFHVDDSALDEFTPPNHFNSVTASTIIKTKRGDIPIVDVAVGDKVVTHRGRWRSVTAVMGKRSDHPVVRELLLSTGRRLRITDEHPVLTTDGWKTAGEMNVGEILVQYGDQVPGFADMGVFRPDDCPSLFNQGAVPYEVFRQSSPSALVAVNLQRDSMLWPREIDNKPIDCVLEHGRIVSDQNFDHFLFGVGRVVSPRFSSALSGTLRRVVDQVSIPALHSLRMLGVNLACFFAQSIRPMSWPSWLCPAGGVGDGCLSYAVTNGDAMSFAPGGKDGFADAKFALDLSDRFIEHEMLASDKRGNGRSISEVHFDDPVKWSGAAIVSIVDVENNEALWNLAVDEDESYLANDIIVHNCRAVLVPVMIDEQPSPDEFITESEKGRARDLAGEGFL